MRFLTFRSHCGGSPLLLEDGENHGPARGRKNSKSLANAGIIGAKLKPIAMHRRRRSPKTGHCPPSVTGSRRKREGNSFALDLIAQRNRLRGHRSPRWPFLWILGLGLFVGMLGAACKNSAPKAKPGEALSERAGQPDPKAGHQSAAQTPKAAPSRIVSLGGGVSETVAALGRLDAIVGTDSTSLYPASLQKRPKVGYFRAFSPEGVVSLKPELVLASDGVGPKAAISVLRDAGITFTELQDVKNLDDVLTRTQKIGDAIGRPAEAKQLIQKIKTQYAEVRAEHPKLPPKRLRCLFVYARGAGMMLVGGKNTSADAVMRLAGLENAAASISEFGPLSAEGLVTFKPDIIFIPEKGLQSIGGEKGLLAVPGVAATPAGKAKRIITMEDSRLLAMGPRTPEVARDLMRAAYPEVFSK